MGRKQTISFFELKVLLSQILAGMGSIALKQQPQAEMLLQTCVPVSRFFDGAAVQGRAAAVAAGNNRILRRA